MWTACGTPNRDGRVVGGHPTSAGKYPWLASLTYRGKLYCGASLVSDRYIVTAAHCIRRSVLNLNQTLKSYLWHHHCFEYTLLLHPDYCSIVFTVSFTFCFTIALFSIVGYTTVELSDTVLYLIWYFFPIFFFITKHYSLFSHIVLLSILNFFF